MITDPKGDLRRSPGGTNGASGDGGAITLLRNPDMVSGPCPDENASVGAQE